MRKYSRTQYKMKMIKYRFKDRMNIVTYKYFTTKKEANLYYNKYKLAHGYVEYEQL